MLISKTEKQLLTLVIEGLRNAQTEQNPTKKGIYLNTSILILDALTTDSKLSD